MPRPKTPNLYLPVYAVTWVDACYAEHDHEVPIVPMIDVGFLLKHTETQVTIAHEIWADGGTRHHVSIPTSMGNWVKKVGRVKVPALFHSFPEAADWSEMCKDL